MNILLAFIVIFSVAALAALHYSVSVGDISNTSIDVPTTTTIPATTTTTTQPSSASASMSNLTASHANEESIKWLEHRTFELVNEERIREGLEPLKWNEEILFVCRLHSEDMGTNGFFSHTGTGNTIVGDRLNRERVYYWNLSGENLLMQSGVENYYVNFLGEITNAKYKTLEELSQAAVDGWMNSTGHRENMLKPAYDESAIGIYAVEGVLGDTQYSNTSYYFTQNFITRVGCGYNGGPCCVEQGYLPWCYVPLKCELEICV